MSANIAVGSSVGGACELASSWVPVHRKSTDFEAGCCTEEKVCVGVVL